MKKFKSPAEEAEYNDFKNHPELKEPFLESWSNFVKYSTVNSIMGDPWTSTNDHPRDSYYNPLETPEEPNAIVATIKWSPFPNRIKHYFTSLFETKFKENAEDRLLELADVGPEEFNKRYSEFNINFEVLKNPCNHDTETTSFGPKGPRGWQDEYCEWSVTRDEKGDIVAVDFTHENPEYWFHLWRVSPDLVLSLYKEILNHDNVKLEDLYLRDKDNQPVIVRETNLPAYNPLNKWNCGSVSTETHGGAVHLTSRPNSLSAEIYLAAAATTLRAKNSKSVTSSNQLICVAKYGQIFRNSDPHIGEDVNKIVRSKKKVTLTDPIGLYGRKIDLKGFTLPKGANKKIEDCYSVIRGKTDSEITKDMILHSRFSLPEGANFKLSDIVIGNKKLKWGSQIAKCFNVQLNGTAIPSDKVSNTKGPVGDKTNSLPYISYLMGYDLFEASMFNNLMSYSNLSPCITKIEVGSSISNIVILTTNSVSDTKFNFGKGITVKVDKFVKIDNDCQLFSVTISVDHSVEVGEKPVALFNNVSDSQYTCSGILEVVSKGSLPDFSNKNLHEPGYISEDLIKKLKNES